MNRLIAVGAATVGAVIVFRCLPHETRQRMRSSIAHRLRKHMEKMMAGLPEGAPPKLIMSILPKLLAQNDQIIAMLKEQNELLRGRKRTAR